MSLFSRHKERASHLRDVARRIAPELRKQLNIVPFFDPTGDPEQDAILYASDEAWKKAAAFGIALNTCWFLSGSRAVLGNKDAEQFRTLVMELLSKELNEWAGLRHSDELINRFMDDLNFLDGYYSAGHGAEQQATEFARRLSNAFQEEGICPLNLQILLMCNMQLQTAHYLEQIAKQHL